MGLTGSNWDKPGLTRSDRVKQGQLGPNRIKWANKVKQAQPRSNRVKRTQQGKMEPNKVKWGQVGLNGAKFAISFIPYPLSLTPFP